MSIGSAFQGFQFLSGGVQDIMSKVGHQKDIAQAVMDAIKSYPPQVQSAWIGGDADEFDADVTRRLVPKMQELVAAIAGVNVDLEKAIQIAQSADHDVGKLIGQLEDVVSRIL